MKIKKMIGTALTTAIMASAAVNAFAAGVDPAIPAYKPAQSVAGSVTSVGSDTLGNMMTLWAEGFKKQHPGVNIQIQAAGSSTAPPALTEGASNFGPMSRSMKDKEIKAFEDKFGYKPTEIKVAIDAIGVYVNKDNPIKSMTMQQLDAVFSSAHKCGYNEDITTWGQLNVQGELASKPIQLFGRNSVSGTYGYFKEHALCKGDYKNNVNEQPGSASVVQSVAKSPNGIGYSGIGYQETGIKTVAIAKKSGEEAYEPTEANALAGKYPLSRFLYIYVNKKPNKPLDALEKEFMNYVLSKDGQEVVVKDGFIPMPAKVVEEQLKKLN